MVTEVPKHESDLSLSDTRLAVDDEVNNSVTPSVYVVNCKSMGQKKCREGNFPTLFSQVLQ